MVKALKKAMHGSGIKSRESLLLRVEGELDGIYDLIQQVFGEKQTSLKVLQSVLRKATSRSRKERYERYLRVWLFRVCVESITKSYPRFVGEKLEGQEIPFAYLSLEEKLCLLLRDRCGFSYEDIASILQISVGRTGRSLTYAREKVAVKRGFGSLLKTNLPSRIALNRDLAGSSPYVLSLKKVTDEIAGLPAKPLQEVESTIRQTEILPLLRRPETARWQDLSWQYKLGLEASLLAVVGVLAVVVLPWVFSRMNADALVEGRFAQVFQVESLANEPATTHAEITADRLLASADSADSAEGAMAKEEDEFANVEFPSGDAYEVGSAPLAPSRQTAAVYRLIVQSPSPKELIPQVRSLFAQRNVKEREISGREMPGGVFFDGITNVESYPVIMKAIQGMGQTKMYTNPGASRNPRDRARVIVWVQQI